MWNIYKGLYKNGLGLTAGLTACLAVQGCASYQSYQLDRALRKDSGLYLKDTSHENMAVVQDISEQVNKIFSEKTSACLKDLTYVIAGPIDTEKSAGGTYIHFWFGGQGVIATRDDLLKPELAFPINIHEKFHRLDACRLIDRKRFSKIYELMDSDMYPIKSAVETALKLSSIPIPFKNITDERIAYTAEYWIWYGYELPEEMIQVFAPLLNMRMAKEFKSSIDKAQMEKTAREMLRLLKENTDLEEKIKQVEQGIDELKNQLGAKLKGMRIEGFEGDQVR